jgi:hypothetical protein
MKTIELGSFLTQAFQIDGVDVVIEKKIMPLLYAFHKDNSSKLKATANNITQLAGWTLEGADLKVTSPEDKGFKAGLVEELTSLDLVFTLLASYEATALKPLLEEMIMVFQDIILRGVKLED